MKTFALAPLNRLSAAKSRLSGSLSPDERRALALWMAGRTLRALQDAGVVERVALVSPDPEALDWARERGAVPLWQRAGDLNAGLEQGRAWALERGAGALLILLGDLPCVTAEEIAAFVASAGEAMSPQVALVPDRLGQGTNGLYVRPAGLLPFAFGAGSLARHVERARALGVEPQLFRAPGLSFDVDTPPDARELERLGLWAPNRAAPVLREESA